MSAEAVAEAGLRALERRRAFAVTDWHDRVWIAAGRLLPRTWPPRIAAALFSRTRL
jgi:short-subunit dehydrogenase